MSIIYLPAFFGLRREFLYRQVIRIFRGGPDHIRISPKISKFVPERSEVIKKLIMSHTNFQNRRFEKIVNHTIFFVSFISLYIFLENVSLKLKMQCSNLSFRREELLRSRDQALERGFRPTGVGHDNVYCPRF